MIESIIIIVCDEPTTSRVWGMLLVNLQCHPIIANTISHSRQRQAQAIEQTMCFGCEFFIRTLERSRKIIIQMQASCYLNHTKKL
jgi:hypothetical protein